VAINDSSPLVKTTHCDSTADLKSSCGLKRQRWYWPGVPLFRLYWLMRRHHVRAAYWSVYTHREWSKTPFIFVGICDQSRPKWNFGTL